MTASIDVLASVSLVTRTADLSIYLSVLSALLSEY